MFQIAQIVVSIRTRDARRDVTGDPWDGRSLEWATSSPPPAYNFALLPDVHGGEAYHDMKERADRVAHLRATPDYDPIAVPLGSPTGFLVAFFAFFYGFAMIWHIWWLAMLSFVAALLCFVALAWRDHTEQEVPAEEVARRDRARRDARLHALQAEGSML